MAKKCKIISNKLNTPIGLIVKGLNVKNTNLHEMWVSNNGSGTVTHYSAHGKHVPFIKIIIPGNGTPTGLVWNNNFGFNITGNTTVKSIIITATNDGYIMGWNPIADKKNFIIAHSSDSFYTDIEINNNIIYVTDFKHNKIVTLNSLFTVQDNYPFYDQTLENGFYTYSVKKIENLLYVTYAKNNGFNIPIIFTFNIRI